jgi:hypothetical protein
MEPPPPPKKKEIDERLFLVSGYETHVFTEISHYDKRYILIVSCVGPVLSIKL